MESDSSPNSIEESGSQESEELLSGLNEKEREIIRTRLASAQKQFMEYNSFQKDQKVKDVESRVSGIDEESSQLAIDSCQGNELLAIKRLVEDKDYKSLVLQMAHGECEYDMSRILYRDKKAELREILNLNDNEYSDNDETDDWVMTDIGHSYHVTINFDGGYDANYGSGSDRSHSSENSRHRGEGRKCPRLNLDDALGLLVSLKSEKEEPKKKELKRPIEVVKKAKKKVKVAVEKKKSDSDSYSEEDEGEETYLNHSKKTSKGLLSKETEFFRALSSADASKIPAEALHKLGWSNARINAFRARERNPNQYYYRFNDPGEPQNTGKWSSKDRELFLKLVEEIGVDYQWGIFSMKIPGRVGYQCSNYYRQLIKEGVIKDENYVMNEKGKLMFQFRDRRGRSTLRRSGNHIYDRGCSDEYEIDMEEKVSTDVLPEYIDPMTMEPVVNPAISPYGHVMGYDSWVKLLNREPKNTCPFTKKHLTRRSLVKLNSKNIEEYRGRIVNVNGASINMHTP